jgi:hypothetical protein
MRLFPPSMNVPEPSGLGLELASVFPARIVLINVQVPGMKKAMPPPRVKDDVLFWLLPEIVLFLTTNVPASRIAPPPPKKASGGPVTVFPVMVEPTMVSVPAGLLKIAPPVPPPEPWPSAVFAEKVLLVIVAGPELYSPPPAAEPPGTTAVLFETVH